jgi:hypothetical protein
MSEVGHGGATGRYNGGCDGNRSDSWDQIRSWVRSLKPNRNANRYGHCSVGRTWSLRHRCSCSRSRGQEPTRSGGASGTSAFFPETFGSPDAALGIRVASIEPTLLEDSADPSSAEVDRFKTVAFVKWHPLLVQNARLSCTKRPPEGGGLTRQPDALICETPIGARKVSSNGVLLSRQPCRMRFFGLGNRIKIT